MGMERSGNDLGAIDGTSPSPSPLSEGTSLEESWASPDSRTPNPRPTKIMRMDSSNPPPPLSEMAVEEAPTPNPIAEDESTEKPAGVWRGEEESMEEEYDDDDHIAIIDMCFGSGDSPEESRRTFRTRPFKCDICGGGHSAISCAYLDAIPPGGQLLNHKDYLVVCTCGGDIVDGRCPGCVPSRPKCVVLKSFLERIRKECIASVERFMQNSSAV